MRFRDRRHAGELLGRAVADLAPSQPVVYALPRGGAPVGYEVARRLGCPLDVLIVRKVGLPSQPELAMGAIGEADVVVRNNDVIDQVGVPEALFERVVADERVELDARVSAYRGVAEPVAPSGHTALVVDDGLATGSTALAAIRVLEAGGADQIWLAVPVAPRDTITRLGREVGRLVVVEQPWHFGAVGSWYRDFTQTTDEEVRDLLTRSRLA